VRKIFVYDDEEIPGADVIKLPVGEFYDSSVSMSGNFYELTASIIPNGENISVQLTFGLVAEGDRNGSAFDEISTMGLLAVELLEKMGNLIDKSLHEYVIVHIDTEGEIQDRMASIATRRFKCPFKVYLPH